jgi:hypothetical protein
MTKKEFIIGLAVAGTILLISAIYGTYFPEQVLVRFHEY